MQIIDNTSSGFEPSLGVAQGTGTDPNAFDDVSSLDSATDTNATATFGFSDLQPGTYAVYATWPTQELNSTEVSYGIDQSSAGGGTPTQSGRT